jgi:hypothetical protein
LANTPSAKASKVRSGLGSPRRRSIDACAFVRAARDAARLDARVRVVAEQGEEIASIRVDHGRQRGLEAAVFPGRPDRVGEQRRGAADRRRLAARDHRFQRRNARVGEQDDDDAGQHHHAESVVHGDEHAETDAQRAEQQQLLPCAAEHEMHGHRGQHEAKQRARDAQQSELERAGEIRLEHDRQRHRNPVAVRDAGDAFDRDRDRETHAATQRVAERHRRQAQVRAQRRQRAARTQRARQLRLGLLRAQVAAAACDVRVAQQRTQLSRQRLRVADGDADQSPVLDTRCLGVPLRQRIERRVDAGHRRAAGQRLRAAFERDGHGFERARRVVEHARQRRLRFAVGERAAQVVERDELAADTFGEFGEHAEGLHDFAACAVRAVQQAFDVEDFLGHRRLV